MAFEMDEIRRLADRVAASHHLEVVDVEFGGGGKSRALRVFIEKDAAERARMKQSAQTAKAEEGEAVREKSEAREAAAGEVEDPADFQLPKGVPVELLSGVTHEDCAAFAADFGTLLDVEDVVPGAEYTLEVSSPGLERSLRRVEEFERFAGSLIKVKTFTPVNSNRLWTGRLTGFADGVLKMEPKAGRQPRAAGKQQGKAKKAAVPDVIEIELKNVEKANLVVEI